VRIYAPPHGSIILTFIVLNVKQKEGQARPQQVRVDTFPRGSVLMNELMSLLMQRVAEVGVRRLRCNDRSRPNFFGHPTQVSPGSNIVQLHPLRLHECACILAPCTLINVRACK
jgi:hypothetical protein